jgi:hypothetical protein
MVIEPISPGRRGPETGPPIDSSRSGDDGSRDLERIVDVGEAPRVQVWRRKFAAAPDGTMVAHRAILHGTPVRSAVVLQGIDGSSMAVVQLDAASVDIGEGPCLPCVAPRPSPATCV